MKNDVKRIGLIGAGNIGSELYRRIKDKGWEISFILDKDGLYEDRSDKLGGMRKVDERYGYLPYLWETDAVCLAIPSDDGEAAFTYINNKVMLERRIPVVTCEKGALSNFFPEMERELYRVGYGATVGGGTRMLKYLKERFNPNITEIHAIVNGTLNYIFDEISKGKDLEKVIKTAQKLGYAEPGAEDPLDVINGETKDVVMKSAILYNVCRFNNFHIDNSHIRARDIETKAISNGELEELVKKPNNWRYIVSITKENKERDVVGGFRYRVGNWLISAGFKDINETLLFSRLMVRGVDNALLICEGEQGKDGIYKLSGPGAGPRPTTSSMLIDLERLLK